MSYTKRYYEDHFDEFATWDNLRAQGLSEEEIEMQFDCFSTKRTWDEFVNGTLIDSTENKVHIDRLLDLVNYSISKGKRVLVSDFYANIWLECPDNLIGYFWDEWGLHCPNNEKLVDPTKPITFFS